MKWGTRGTTAGGGRQQKQAQGRWHFLAVQRGAFSPLHRKPLPIHCGHHWPGFLAVWDHSRAFPGGWRAPHAPPVAVCAPRRELPETVMGVSVASSETCLWAGGIGQGQTLLAGGPQHPRGACVVVPTPRWVTASVVSRRRGHAERCLPGAGGCRAVPERAPSARSAAEPSSSRPAAVEPRLASSGLREEVTPATLRPPARLRVHPQWQHVPAAWGQFGGFATCQAPVHTPASCPSLMSRHGRPPPAWQRSAARFTAPATSTIWGTSDRNEPAVPSKTIPQTTAGFPWPENELSSSMHTATSCTTVWPEPLPRTRHRNWGFFLHHQKAKHCWFPFPSYRI